MRCEVNKIDTQETPSNIALVFSLLTLDNTPPNYYFLISQIIYFSAIFFLFFVFVYLQNSRGYKIIAQDASQVLLSKDASWLTQYRMTEGTFNTRIERSSNKP